jgi:hypothetical protein
MFPGQVIVGGCVSLTVTVKLQAGPADVEQVTVVVPTGKNEPDGGLQAIEPHSLLAVGANVTAAPHCPWSFGAVMLAGQVMTQPCCTATVNEQVPAFWAASMTLQFTVVVPTGKVEPDGGLQVGEPTPGQLSLAVGGG